MTPEQLNAWRAVPRALVTMYAIMFWQICDWFMALPDPTGPQSAFVSTVVGAAAGWFGLYVNSGKSRE